MKILKKVMVSSCVVLSLIASVLGTFPQKASAAVTSKTYYLEKEKTQKIQLDGKGEKEKVKYTLKSTRNNEGEWPEKYDNVFSLYINNKRVYTKETVSEQKQGAATVYITDVDKSDKILDIFIGLHSERYASEYNSLDYCQYKNGKFKKVQDLKKYLDSGILDDIKKNGMAEHHYHSTNSFITYGDKKVKMEICSKSGILGDFHGTYTLKLKNGKFVKATTYPEGDIKECNYIGQAVRSAVFYTTPGGSKKAFSIKKGDRVFLKEYKYTKKALYISVEKNGKIGWIKDIPDSKNPIFVFDGVIHA